MLVSPLFRAKRLLAVAAFFLQRATDKKLNDLSLMKLIYLSERRSLQRYGVPVVGDRYVSMRFGPVLESGYQSLLGRNEDEVARYISFRPHRPGQESNHFCLIEAFDPAEVLSESALGLLHEVWEEFGELAQQRDGKWALVDLTHTFPEWDKRAKIRNTKVPLPLETVFTLGFGEDPEVARVKADEIEDLMAYRA